MSLISIIVPVYNVEKYLFRCLESILNQTYQDFELVLVDDGSLDDSGKICDQYAENDKRIHVFHQENKGQGAARNLALNWVYKNSDSQYITFIDSDDLVHPRYVELLLKAIQKHNTKISQCLYIESADFSGFEDLTEESISISAKEAYIDWYCAFMCCKMFHIDCLRNIRFPEGQIYEDVAIWYQILFAEKQLSIVEDKLYFYCVNPTSTVRSAWSPKRLAQVDVWNQQIEYINKLGDQQVLHTALKRGCWVYKHQCEEISISSLVSESEKRLYRKEIIQKLQAVLMHYKEDLKEIGIYNTYFEFAYPKITWIKWTALGIFGKFRR